MSEHPPSTSSGAGCCPPFSLRVIESSCKRSGRGLEDTATIVPYLAAVGGEPGHLFLVCDGHGGAGVSQHCAGVLHRHLKAELQSRQAASLANQSSQWRAAILEALAAAIKATDDSLTQEHDRQASGSTVVAVLVAAHDIFVAHAGDSRAVLCRNDGVLELTSDHSPQRPDEQRRIENAGGRIFWNGGDRVMGVLAMTRSIGDYDLRPYGVTAIPEVMHLSRSSDDRFLILASDGLWNKLSSEEACREADATINKVMVGSGRSRRTAVVVAADVVARKARSAGSRDDITVMVIDLHPDAQPLTQAQAAMLQKRCEDCAAKGTSPLCGGSGANPRRASTGNQSMQRAGSVMMSAASLVSMDTAASLSTVLSVSPSSEFCRSSPFAVATGSADGPVGVKRPVEAVLSPFDRQQPEARRAPSIPATASSPGMLEGRNTPLEGRCSGMMDRLQSNAGRGTDAFMRVLST